MLKVSFDIYSIIPFTQHYGFWGLSMLIHLTSVYSFSFIVYYMDIPWFIVIINAEHVCIDHFVHIARDSRI